jgi:sulfur carrier protein
MRTEINGESRDLPPGTTLVDLLAALSTSTRGSAAVVDGEVVPRAEWPTYEIRDGQVIELITAVQGG